MYTIGQLSKKTGVTVRTLDYYDEIGLIKPSAKTNGGHRLYNEDDVMRLERVLALKYMGFNLEKIKGILEESTLNWQQSIQQQLEMIQQEKQRLDSLEQALKGVSFSIEIEGEVNWSIIFGIIQLYQQKDPEEALHQAFQQYEEYLSREEMKRIIEMDAKIGDEAIQEWVHIISEIKKNLSAEPCSDLAQELTDRWVKQAEKMFGGDDQLLGSIAEAFKNMKEGIAFYPMDKDVVHFIEQALLYKEEMDAHVNKK